MRPTVREADLDDAGGIATVHVASWRAAYRGVVPDEFLDQLSVAKRAESWREQLRRRERRTLVAESGGTIVGFVAAGPTRDPFPAPGTGEVYALYVDPDAWGQGVGSTLLARAVEELKKRGFASATLWVLTTNDLARRFYERKGWRVEGARQTYPIGGIDLEEIRYRIVL